MYCIYQSSQGQIPSASNQNVNLYHSHSVYLNFIHPYKDNKCHCLTPRFMKNIEGQLTGWVHSHCHEELFQFRTGICSSLWKMTSGHRLFGIKLSYFRLCLWFQTIFGFLGIFFFLYHNGFLITHWKHIQVHKCDTQASDFSQLLVPSLRELPDDGKIEAGTFPKGNGMETCFLCSQSGRGMHIGTISSGVESKHHHRLGSCRWAGLKPHAPFYIRPSDILCWTLAILVNTTFPVYVTGKWNGKTVRKREDLGDCLWSLIKNY